MVFRKIMLLSLQRLSSGLTLALEAGQVHACHWTTVASATVALLSGPKLIWSLTLNYIDS